MAEYRVSVQFGSGRHFFQGPLLNNSAEVEAHLSHLIRVYHAPWLRLAKTHKRRAPKPIIRVWEKVGAFAPKENKNG